MTSPKGSYYTTQLFIALTAGEWLSETPSKGSKRGGLSWSELLRKFRKHRPDAHDIAEIASYTQALSLLLMRPREATPEALDGDHTQPDEPLALGPECLLCEEYRDEAFAGYQALQNLTKDEAVYLALAYYAYSLGLFSDALAYLSSVSYDDVLSSLNASNVGSISTAMSVAVAQHSSTVAGSVVGGFTPSITALDSSLKEGRVWRLTQLIRGRCLQGMAYESSSPRQLDDALESYENTICLLDQITIPKSFPLTSGEANFESFTRYRELWRWVERALWRAAILSSQTRSLAHTHRNLQIYQAQSVHWPATFRPEHRSTIAQLHLHVLIRSHSSNSKAAWLNQTRSIVTDYRIILNATTSFPRAGEENVKVEEFVDLCVAAWEVNGASRDQTGWVLDILWWATRFTFNSQRIYRHLARLLYASGDTELARRALNLYVQVVTKARQTGASVESDRVWVETLVQGARMLCRVPGGIEEVREAGDLLRQAEEKVDNNVEIATAAFKRAKGIWHGCMAMRDNEISTRSEHLAQSLEELQESLKLYSDPSTHFHLALALYRPVPSRDLAAAIFNAKEAVLGCPKEIRYWHLLGLLLAATEEWKDAKIALQKGSELSDDEGSDGEDGPQCTPSTNGHTNPDEDGSSSQAEAASADSFDGAFLDEQSLQLPEASTLFRPTPDYPPPTRHERFEHALQLRLTQLALIEHVDGPETAGNKWLEVFSWVAARKGLGEERRPPSVEPPPSDLSEPRPQQLQPLTLVKSRTSQMNGNVDIPINLVPPSPTPSRNADMSDNEKQDDKEQHKGKKVQRILKDQVHRGQAHIHMISKKIGAKHGMRIRRSSSTPDFVLAPTDLKPYQASSIHSRQRLSINLIREHSPEPPPASPKKPASIFIGRSSRERRLLSNLWLTAAATFRRIGKIEQAKAAIQEAEVADEDNEEVWVQLGLYHGASGEKEKAIQSFHKALFLQPEHVPAFIHLTQQYLKPQPVSGPGQQEIPPSQENIDLAAGLLAELTRGVGWDIPEAWYFLARASKLQGKLDRERECLSFALSLVEGRSLRDMKSAVGWCL